MPALDFNQLMQKADEATSFEPLAEGDYEFVIDEAPKVENEKYRISVKAKVLEGPRKGATAFQNLTFDPSAKAFPLKLTFDFLAAIGLDRSTVAQAKSLEDIAGVLQNRRFTATATIREYEWEGKTRKSNNLNNFRPATGTVAGPGQPGPAVMGGPGPGTAPVAQAAPAPAPTPQAAPQSVPNPWDDLPQAQAQAAPQSAPAQGGFTPPPSFPSMPLGGQG